MPVFLKKIADIIKIFDVPVKSNPASASSQNINQCPKCPDLICPDMPACPETYMFLFYGLLSALVIYYVVNLVIKLKYKQ